jgi:glycosyltransferase involved in cell wall biosynthesis
MNLLLITPFFTPQTGGVATYLEDLRRCLSQKGHNVYVLKPGESHSITLSQENPDGWVYEFALRSLWYPESPLRGLIAFFVFLLPTLWRLTAFLKRHKIEVVSLEYPVAWMAYIFIVRLWTPIKITIGLHGSDVLELHKSYRYEQWLVKHMIRRADWVLAHSSSLLSQTEQLVKRRSDNWSYIPYGVECSRLREQAATSGRALPAHSARYALTVAKLYPRKAIDILLESISKLGPRTHDVCFAIAGNGPEEQALQQKARELRIEKQIVFLGEIENKDIPALLKKCEFFVLPSRSEPFGIVFLEAMTFGKAIVATNVGGIPEFVVDGFNGLLVPSEDSDALAEKIELCIENQDVRERLGHNGLSVVETRYDYPALIFRYERLYETILGKGSSA